MGLLEKIEKKMQHHPLDEETLESKIYFLNAIAYFISIDDVISRSEKAAFNSIIELLNCEDAKDDLYDFMENPDVDEFENIFYYLKENNYSLSYILDIFYLVEDNKLNKKEKKLLNIILELFDYKEDDILPLLDFCNAIKKENTEYIVGFFAELDRNDFLINNKESIQQFYELTIKLQRNSSNSFFDILSIPKDMNDMYKVANKVNKSINEASDNITKMVKNYYHK